MAGPLSGVAIFSCVLCPCAAFQDYQDNIPNGHRVDRFGSTWDGVGHLSSGGSGRNPFGFAFAAHGKEWTTALCEADSDGDGQSNGYELGDPNCVWTEGDTPERTVAVSHPGFCDTIVHEATNQSVVTVTNRCHSTLFTASSTTSSAYSGSSTSSSGTVSTRSTDALTSTVHLSTDFVVVEGSLELEFSIGSAGDFLEAYNNDTTGAVKQLLQEAVTAPLDDVTAKLVTIMGVVINNRRLTATLIISFEIDVIETSGEATTIVAVLTDSSTPTAITNTLNAGLASADIDFVLSDIVVADVTVRTQAATSTTSLEVGSSYNSKDLSSCIRTLLLAILAGA